jgi:hypothetical protein
LVAPTTHDIPGAEQAQEKAQQAAGQMQARLREQIAQRSTQAAEQISTQTSDLRAVSESLREQGKDGPADVADRIAGYAERVGDYLHEKDADTLLSDAEDLGRRKPWVAAAGGLAIGFAASRFLKASSRERYESRSRQSTWPEPQSTWPDTPTERFPTAPASLGSPEPGTPTEPFSTAPASLGSPEQERTVL